MPDTPVSGDKQKSQHKSCVDFVFFTRRQGEYHCEAISPTEGGYHSPTRRISLQTSPCRGSLFSRTGRAPMRRNPALCRWVSSPSFQYFQRPLRRMQGGRPAHHSGIWTPFLSCGFLHEACGSFDRTHPAGQAAHCYQCDHVVLVTPHEKALTRAFCSLWFIVRRYNAHLIFTSLWNICAPAGQAAHCYQCDHVVLVTPHEKALPRAFCSLWFIVRRYNAHLIFNGACALDRKRAFDRFSTSLPRDVSPLRGSQQSYEFFRYSLAGRKNCKRCLFARNEFNPLHGFASRRNFLYAASRREYKVSYTSSDPDSGASRSKSPIN